MVMMTALKKVAQYADQISLIYLLTLVVDLLANLLDLLFNVVDFAIC